MLAAVNFDNDAMVETNKVNDEAINRYLATELETGESAIAQQSPHSGFRFGWRATHLPRETAALFRRRTMVKCGRH